MQQHLKPVKSPEARRLEQLIADLDSNDFDKRRDAADELARFGELAEPALKKALASKPALEVRQRVEELLGRLVRRLPLEPESLRETRAIETLEMLATQEARQLLEALAQGAAGARVTREAKSALDRLAPK